MIREDTSVSSLLGKTGIFTFFLLSLLPGSLYLASYGALKLGAGLFAGGNVDGPVRHERWAVHHPVGSQAGAGEPGMGQDIR